MEAGQPHKAEEVVDVVLPASDEPAEVVQPSKQSLHPPATPIAPQFASVLRPASLAPVRRDQLDVVVFGELLVELVRVVGFIANQPRGQLVEEAAGQNCLHKLTLGRRSAVDSNGERKTVASGNSEDLGALAAPRGAHREAPFFALAKVASTNASFKFNWPRWCKCRASTANASSNWPLRTHC